MPLFRMTLPGAVLITALLLAACASTPKGAPALPRADQVDLDQFSGDWYVIAHIPTWFERDAYNAVETYRVDDDGSVATTFRFRRGSFDARVREMTPRGYPDADTSNAEWGMSFIWPFRAEYIVADLDEDYETTIIGRTARDYVWLMHRAPVMTPEALRVALGRIRDMGYDMTELRMVPQRWPEAAQE